MDAPDNSPVDPSTANPESPERRTIRGPAPAASAFAAISWLRDLTVSVLIAVVVILFLYQPVKVEGTSMMPALVDQERIFINKFAYRFGIWPTSSGAIRWCSGFRAILRNPIIKRVIGVPGDKVQVTDGHVSVNETRSTSRTCRKPIATTSQRRCG